MKLSEILGEAEVDHKAKGEEHDKKAAEHDRAAKRNGKGGFKSHGDARAREMFYNRSMSDHHKKERDAHFSKIKSSEVW